MYWIALHSTSVSYKVCRCPSAGRDLFQSFSDKLPILIPESSLNYLKTGCQLHFFTHCFNGLIFWSQFAATFSNKWEYTSQKRERNEVVYSNHRPWCNVATRQAIFWESGATKWLEKHQLLSSITATAISYSTYTHNSWLSAVHSWHGTLGFVKMHSG